MGLSQESDLERLKEKVLAKRTRWLVWTESLLILGLLVWISIEYENNAYLRSWLGDYIGPLGFLFNGALAGLYAGGLAGYVLAWYAGRKSEEEKLLDRIRREPNLAGR